MTRRLSALPSKVGTIDLAVQKLGTDNIFVWGPSPDMSHWIVALYRFRAAALVVVDRPARWHKSPTTESPFAPTDDPRDASVIEAHGILADLVMKSG